MLVSTKDDHRRLFASLRTVVVDEVHAFAGDDPGWHLLAVLERLSRLAGRPLQRVGLSATPTNFCAGSKAPPTVRDAWSHQVWCCRENRPATDVP